MAEVPSPGVDIQLSPREQEILDLLIDELTNRQIALQLGISEKMVEKHLTHVYRKTNTRSRAGAVAWALMRKDQR